RAPIVAFPAARRVLSRRLLPTLAAVRELRRAQLLLVSGGGLIHDHWAIVIPRYLAWSLLARALGLRIAWVGVGVGPIRRRWARRMAAAAARLAGLVTVRDAQSAAWLARIGVAATARVVPDPAFFCERHTGSGDGGTALIVRRPVPGQAAREAAVTTAMAGLAARRMAASGRVTILGMERDTDYAAEVAAAAASEGAPRPDVRALPLDPAEATAELSTLGAVVSMRLHGLILAALAGTPCVPVVYDEKVAATAARLGLGDVAVGLDRVTTDVLEAGLATVSSNAHRARVNQAVSELQDQGPELANAIARLIND
ncbi:MAG: polysaccharide pyruvyl transferase family protein, partial [Candidatus Limnocylindria bacterium]